MATTVLVALAALFAFHPPPIGPFALVCLAVAAWDSSSYGASATIKR